MPKTPRKPADARRGKLFHVSSGARCAFPGSGDSKNLLDLLLTLVSAHPKESQGNSLATVLTAAISTIFTASTKVAAFGRHHKRGGAAFGRPTSFLLFFVLALNTVNIVAVTTILVLPVGNGRSEHV